LILAKGCIKWRVYWHFYGCNCWI